MILFQVCTYSTRLTVREVEMKTALEITLTSNLTVKIFLWSSPPEKALQYLRSRSQIRIQKIEAIRREETTPATVEIPPVLFLSQNEIAPGYAKIPRLWVLVVSYSRTMGETRFNLVPIKVTIG